jgi:murein DD-endopeptidase
MRIKWNNLYVVKQQRFDKMSELDKFVYFLMKLYGSPYGWGKENPEASDCSGAVCMALFAATGLLIRTTADDLFKRVFTVANPRANQIRAVFYVTKKDRRHGDRMVAAGTATHIAGIIEDGIILNSQEPFAKVRLINDVSNWYQRNDHEVVVRGLNRDVFERLAREGEAVFGLDPEFHHYFNVGGVN